MRRRVFMKGAAATGLAAAATSGFAAPAISQGRMEWRMVTTWPKNFPGLGTAAELLADSITKGTNGRLSVRVYGAGEIVPAFESLDAVAGGTVEMGHGSPYYWKGKLAAAQFLTAFPFGLIAQEQNAWFQWGGGQEIADEIYAELGCKFFPCGNTGTQMGGWFNKEINDLEDYKGLKMRMPGLGGEVIKAAGANVVNLPGAEIPPALQSGAIDAAEWVGPYNDLAFGLYKSAKFYYYPGWQEPCATLDSFINRTAWEKLPGDIQAVIAAANGAINQQVLSEFVARNNTSLRTLIDEHGISLKTFPDAVLKRLASLSDDVMNDLASRDSLSQKVMNSMLSFRKDVSAWTAIAETAMSKARLL